MVKSLGKNKLLYFLTLFLNTLSSLSIVSEMFFTGQVLSYAFNFDEKKFYLFLTLELINAIIIVFFTLLNSWLKTLLIENYSYLLRSKLSNTLMRYSDENMKIESGKISSIFISDIDKISENFISSSIVFVRSLFTVVGILVVTFYFSWLLTLVIIIISSFVLITPIIMNKRYSKYSVEMMNNKNNYSENLQNEFGNIKANTFLRSFASLQRKIIGIDKEYEKMSIVLFFKLSRIEFWMLIINIVAQTLSIVLSGLFLWWGFIGVAAFTTFSMVIGNFNSSIQQLSQSIPSLNVAKKLYKQKIMDTEQMYDDEDIKKIELKDFNILHNERPFFKNSISISLEAGKKYLISGENGSGKSSILNGIFGAKKYTGEILINNKPINKNWFVGRSWLLKSKSSFANGSVIDNVSCFVDNLDIEKMRSVLVEIGAIDLIDVVDINKLTDSQKQLIAIARVLYSDCKWLFFDEAFSLIDDMKINKIIDYISKNKLTLVVISHQQVVIGGEYDGKIEL